MVTATDPPPPFSYHIRNDDGTTEASFNVLVGDDRTIYGQPHLVLTRRLNEGITGTTQHGTTPDTRSLQPIWLTNTRGSFAAAIESLFKENGIKSLTFPDFNTDGESSATTSGSYLMVGLERMGDHVDTLRFRMTLMGKTGNTVS